MEKFLCLCAWGHKPCLGLQSPAGLGWEQEVLGGCWPCPVPHWWWRLMWQESGRVIRNLSTLKSWLLLGSFLGLTGCGGVELWVLSPHPAQAAAGGLPSPHEINATIYTRETQRFEVWFFNFFFKHLLENISSSPTFGCCFSPCWLFLSFCSSRSPVVGCPGL